MRLNSFRKKREKIHKSFGVESLRTQNIVKHVSYSLFYKVGGIGANFLLVPLTINFLDTDNYGIWLTLSSFIAWFSFFDIGLGNGLRNKFSESKSLGNINLARSYVSTSYFTITVISFFLFLSFSISNFLVDWTQIFNVDQNLFKELRLLMPLIFGFFCVQLILKLITTIYTADQNHSMQGKIQFITQTLSLIIIWLLTKTSDGSLLIFGIIFSALPTIVLLVLNFTAFSTTYKEFKPSIALFKFEYLEDLMGLGIKFFIVQFAAIILFSTDNFIIIRLFGPDQVVPYNIAYKYFSLITMGYSIIVTPFWSSFTEAYVKKEYQWIKKSVNSILKLWLFIPLMLILMVLWADYFYNFWIGDKVEVSLMLSISMAFFVLLMTFNTIFTYFINGVGKIKLQLIGSLISIFINIPLSIFFAKVLDFGISGVILASSVSLLYSVVIAPVQYRKIINNNAKGIWNK